MYTKLSLVLDEKEIISVFMQVSVNGFDLTITYFDQSGAIITTDKISQFNSIELSEKNHLLVKFKSPFTDRAVLFANKTDFSTFIDFLQDNIVLVPSVSNPLSFRIELRKPGNNGLLNFVTDVVKSFTPQTNKQTIKRPVDAFTYGSIVQSIPDIKCGNISAEIAKTADLSSIKFSISNIDSQAFPVIFNRLLLVKDSAKMKSDYTPLVEQWKSTTKAEWGHHEALRVFVRETEKFIFGMQTSNLYKQLCFDLALSLFTFYFGAIKVDDELLFEIMTLASVYIKELADGKLAQQNGEVISLEDAEVLCFWPLLELHKKMSAARLSVPQESLKVRTMLEGISSSTVAMLDDRNYKSLDFAAPDARILFTRGREPKIAAAILASALASGNIPVVRQSMLSAAIVLLHEKLQDVPIEEPQCFSELFTLNIRSLDGHLLLYNAEKMLSSARHTTPKSP